MHAPKLYSNAVKLFQIRVETMVPGGGEGEVILHGMASEASGYRLRGTLVLSLSDNFNVKSIGLRFLGEMKIGWVEASSTPYQKSWKEDRTLMDHTWTFVSSLHTLPPGNHVWPFEITLPGSTPETVAPINANHSQVLYYLKASIDRPGLSSNLSTKLPIRVIRIPLSSSLDLMQSLAFVNCWERKVRYEVVLPSRGIVKGSHFLANVRLEMLSKKLFVRGVNWVLAEVLTLTVQTQRRAIDTVLAAGGQDVETAHSEEKPNYDILLPIKVPQSGLRCDADIAGLRIRHKITFYIMISDRRRHHMQLYISLPVTIVDQRFGEMVNTLPTYGESFSVPAIAGSPAQTREPLGASDYMGLAQALNGESEAPGLSPLERLKLMRLPSYRTALRESPLNLPVSDSLPSYLDISSRLPS
ncbi:uncharacterized protein VTP21DRAFT_11224 [Calcarisporiella thermophila]|uniref:uncharacterized protein n=1 Tax=Calcarisporiella thermophila TaxID=911321 RepID=UPI003741F972